MTEGGRKKLLLGVIAGCVVVIGGVMVLAVVLNAREARDFAANGVHVTAQITDKFTRTERVGRTDQTHYCLHVTFTTPDGRTDSSSSCDRGIDQLFDRLHPGDPIRIVYKPDLEFMLEDWASGKLTSL